MHAKYVLGEDDEHVIREYQIEGEELDTAAMKQGFNTTSEIRSVLINPDQMKNAGTYRTAALYSFEFPRHKNEKLLNDRVIQNNDRSLIIGSADNVSSNDCSNDCNDCNNVCINVNNDATGAEPASTTAHITDGGTSTEANINVDYIPEKILDVMRSFYKFVLSVVDEQIMTRNIRIVTIGDTKLIEFLQHDFKNITHITFNDAVILRSKYPKCKFVQVESIEHVANIDEVMEADVVIFNHVFYKLDPEITFEQLRRLKKDPIVIINEPTIDHHWDDPELNKTDPKFNEKKYQNTLIHLQNTAQFIARAEIFSTIRHVNDPKHNIVVLRKFKLEVSLGMKYTKNIMLMMIQKYLGRNTTDLVLLDVGTGGGRYALYLYSYFDATYGIDSNAHKIETAISIAAGRHASITYICSDAENMYAVVNQYKIDVVLFSNSFDRMRYDEVIEQLVKLRQNRKILIFIKTVTESNKYEVIPMLNRYGNEFNPEFHKKHVTELKRACEYIERQTELTLLEKFVDDSSSSIIYVLV